MSDMHIIPGTVSLSFIHDFPRLVTCVEANPPKAFLCPLSQRTSLLTEASLGAKSGLET